ncbi:flagellar export pore protein [Wigglesworthia glossinidia endosymbiont of Glossina morsitans morsitans (Yale colony)]|uniref:Flagellar biosynthetic protein FliR n=1 Tax=Wigglesworthia glossinidia endosymbiont of Glossina morsitans morsitans (Yale colony) TaxID=1142511 RepID=H6Q5K9_WIGGL|nr:flagellar biosynthetic protein FliR [Wigglesworthia glossinidia]AFA40913.1 flagellar export pore protein [Wigglesworthia glossinidia endosymbiont of Glossina morsitans morsitans (Yale colony)]
MIDISTNFFFDLIHQVIWYVARINGLFISAPLFSENIIQKKIKIGISILLSLVFAYQFPLINIKFFSFEGIYLLIVQIIIGFLIGLILQFSFCSVKFAGELIGLQMSLSFAVFFDQISGPNTPIISRFLYIMLALIFLSFNAHLIIFHIIFISFKLIPINMHFNFGNEIFFSIINYSGIIFNYGLLLAIPSITALLILNILLGVLNRFNPQFSIFVIGFSFTLVLGLLSLNFILSNFENFSKKVIEDVFRYITENLIY